MDSHAKAASGSHPQNRKKSDLAYKGPLDTPAIYFSALVLSIALYYADQSNDLVAKMNDWLSFSPNLADVLIRMHGWTLALTKNNLFLLCILVTIAVFVITNMSVKRLSAVGEAIASRISRTQYTTRISAKEFENEKVDYTQKKIEELVNSQAYKNHLSERNDDHAQCNWQAHQSKNGGNPRFYQQKDFNLKAELERVDRELRTEEKFENHMSGNSGLNSQEANDDQRMALNQTHIESSAHLNLMSSPQKDDKLQQSGQGSTLRTTVTKGQYSNMKGSDMQAKKHLDMSAEMNPAVSQYHN